MSGDWQTIDIALPATILKQGNNLLTFAIIESSPTANTFNDEMSSLLVDYLSIEGPHNRYGNDAVDLNLRERKAIFNSTGALALFVDPQTRAQFRFQLESTYKGKESQKTNQLNFTLKCTSKEGKTVTLLNNIIRFENDHQEFSLKLPDDVGLSKLEAILAVEQGYYPENFTLTLGFPTLIEENTQKKDVSTGPPSMDKLSVAVPEKIIFTLLDAARPDHFGCYGYPQPTTPNVDRLSKTGMVYTNAYAPAPYTLATVTSLLTGLYPQCHRIVSLKDKLGSRATTLQEHMSAMGYKTLLVSATRFLGDHFGLNQGFDDQYDYLKPKLRKKKKDRRKFNGEIPPDSMELLPGIEQFVDKYKSDWFFLYAHLFQPHHPYYSQLHFENRYTNAKRVINGNTKTLVALDMGKRELAPQEKQYLEALYDGSLYNSDRMVGQFISKLKREQIWDDTVFCLFADHGEAFGEHDRFLHNSTNYDEMIKVPLIVKLHQPQKTKGHYTHPTSLLLISWSLFDLVNGSLQTLIKTGMGDWDEKIDAVPVVSSITGLREYAIIEDGYKYVRNVYSGEKLFNLRTDPEEKINLNRDNPVLCGKIRLKFDVWLREQTNCAIAQRQVLREDSVLEDSTKQFLEALGYVE